MVADGCRDAVLAVRDELPARASHHPKPCMDWPGPRPVTSFCWACGSGVICRAWPDLRRHGRILEGGLCGVGTLPLWWALLALAPFPVTHRPTVPALLAP
jgi:hypothetical protein